MKKKLLLWSLLFALSFPTASGQIKEGKSFLSKWGVGVGYNFLHRSEPPFNARTYEVSVKYRHTEKHSFYLTMPFYFENNKKEQQEWKEYNDLWLHRIWGAGIGYDYTAFEWKGLSAFGGVGFDYLHSLWQKKIHIYSEDEWGNRYEDYYIWGYINNGYGLSPQIGLTYRFKHVGCELKYKFTVYRIREEDDTRRSDGSYIDHGDDRYKFKHFFRCSNGLSLSLFYYF